jgi:hypothetical protein
MTLQAFKIPAAMTGTNFFHGFGGLAGHENVFKRGAIWLSGLGILSEYNTAVTPA